MAETLLGFDYGRSRIGVAVGQTLTASARPLTTLPARHGQPDWQTIERLIAEWRPQRLVVGVAYHADGSASDSSTAALRFRDRLAQRFDGPVETVDERLSSREAERHLGAGARDKEAVDRVAAALILESWLRMTCA